MSQLPIPTRLNANTKLPSQFNRDHDKPAMLGTKRSAFDTPANSAGEPRFDDEWRHAVSAHHASALAVAALLVAGLAATGVWLCL